MAEFKSSAVLKSSNTIVSSQISVYSGRAGSSSKIPFMERTTNGCSQKFTPSSKTRIDESVERAVFIALYTQPDLYNETGNAKLWSQKYFYHLTRWPCLLEVISRSFAPRGKSYKFNPSLTRDVREGSIKFQLVSILLAEGLSGTMLELVIPSAGKPPVFSRSSTCLELLGRHWKGENTKIEVVPVYSRLNASMARASVSGL